MKKYGCVKVKLLLFFITVTAQFLCFCEGTITNSETRSTENFGKNWKFRLGDLKDSERPTFDDSGWRLLNLPHDWSIEGPFSKDAPATPGGGALPGGIGWYRKIFYLPEIQKDKMVFVNFDGIYMNSEVWMNGHYMGKRPNGYISFRYDLTPFLNYGQEKNVIAVRVDNSLQPNSRWYSGSGIYRNVWLVITDRIHIDHWGICVTTPEVNEQAASVNIVTRLRNTSEQDRILTLRTSICNENGKELLSVVSDTLCSREAIIEVKHSLVIRTPYLWSIERPYLYKAISRIESNGVVCDKYETSFGIRTYTFDKDNGFFLNGKPVKILGVCNHHDLGCLGAAVNKRALERQLEILKEMGCNSIRTAHNPPAPELLDLCDRMGFLVMDEIFDMWKKNKSPYDYALYWDEWHEQDLRDFVLRDRNHPSVIMWSIGNEILEQWDTSATGMAIKLASLVSELDPTRPITSGCNDPNPHNFIIQSGALDVIGYNYHHQDFESFPTTFPGQAFIASETNSALATRGHYDMPSDSIRRWPERWDKPFLDGNPDNTCSSYDNCSTPWGSTHAETWRIIAKHNFLSGMYIWTGFDYLGEPTPYGWPSRSSYFGVIDLAGFPKDAYYFYKSAWTNDPVLHLFPHWNWQKGDSIDVWAYTNCEEVELYLNEMSMGIQYKSDDTMHLLWRLVYTPGTLKGIGRLNKKDILVTKVETAGDPSQIVLEADRHLIKADGQDLSFVTVRILDKSGLPVPYADNLIQFKVDGEGSIAGVDNGLQTSHEPFKADYRKAFHGMCLVVIQSTEKSGKILLRAISDGLKGSEIVIVAK